MLKNVIWKISLVLCVNNRSPVKHTLYLFSLLNPIKQKILLASRNTLMDINVYIYPRMVSITMMVSMFDNICNVCRLLSNNKKYLYMPTTVVKFYISLFILPYTTLSHILYYTCEGTFKYYMSTSWPGDFNQGKCLVRLTYVHKLIIYLKTKIPILKYRWKLSLQNLYQEALFNKILLSNNHFVGGEGPKVLENMIYMKYLNVHLQ